MAVKAREEVRSTALGTFPLLLIFVVIAGYLFFYNRIVMSLEDYTLKTIIEVATLVVMTVAFFVVLRYNTTSFYMVLTHKSLSIDRKIFFWTKRVAEIPTSIMVNILPAENFKGGNGKKYNYTVGRMEGRNKYVLLYNSAGKVDSVKLQCSDKFYNELKQLVNRKK